MNLNSGGLAKAVQLHASGQLELAERIYRQILASEPNHAEALHLLGVIAHQTGNSEASIDYITRSIQQNPTLPAAHGNLAIAYHDLHRYPEAIASYRKALELLPNDLETLVNLGVALRNMGSGQEAVGYFQRAIELMPDCVEALNNLGIELTDQGRLDEAIECFNRAIQSRPESAELFNNRGNTLKRRGDLDEAVASYQRAIQLRPDYAEAYNNLGNAQKDQGKLDEAIASFDRACQSSPGFAAADSNRIYSHLFSPEANRTSILEAHRRWNQVHAVPLKASIQPHRNSRVPNRRLRIGYLSPDFRDHCQALFTTPLFQSHDHAAFEIFCYSDVSHPDGATTRLRSCVDRWKSVVGMDDDRVAEMIRQDEIDILVDLTMHMAYNRLLVFARKPAPVQVCWLAYPGTTGLSTMDYRLTDPYLDPPGLFDDSYSEESIPLPATFWCYDPLDDDSTVNPLPADRNGFITFGCLNNFCKVNSAVIDLWIRVLNAVDRSRLVILCNEGSHRQNTLDTLACGGIEGCRVTFVSLKPRQEYLANYYGIDVGLDTFPYNGHTTSLDSYWMGVPVVTLVGKTVVGRAGFSQLMNLGLPDLIGKDPNEYVSIVEQLARSPDRLRELRSTLRQRMKSSALMDAPRFAKDIEAAYREMWCRWCRKNEVSLAPDLRPID